MNKERIIESWRKATRIPEIPAYLQELITLTFTAPGDAPVSKILDNFINSRSEELKNIAGEPPFHLKTDIAHREALNEPANTGLIRNCAFIWWLQEELAVQMKDHMDFDCWKREAFVSAFYARHLARNFLKDNPEDVFLIALLKDIYLPVLAFTFPSIFKEIDTLSLKEKLNPLSVEKVISAAPAELSGWILQKWGFPEEFYRGLQMGDGQNESSRLGNLVSFSRFIAEFTLKRDSQLTYASLEEKFSSCFQQSAKQFQELLVEVIRVLPRQAAQFGYGELLDLTIIEVLQDHLNLLDQDLLTYNDLLSETLRAQKKISHQATQIQQLQLQLKNNYIRDPITELYNHMYLREFLAHKLYEANRYEYPITLILLDLDNFQSFNNTFGYPAGNEVLKQVANLIRSNIRQSDFIARFGCDEYAIVLPYTGIPQSRLVVEKIHKLICEFKFVDTYNHKSHKITVSIGFTSVLPQGKLGDDRNLLSMVIKALRQSQKTGGNSVTQA